MQLAHRASGKTIQNPFRLKGNIGRNRARLSSAFLPLVPFAVSRPADIGRRGIALIVWLRGRLLCLGLVATGNVYVYMCTCTCKVIRNGTIIGMVVFFAVRMQPKTTCAYPHACGHDLC